MIYPIRFWAVILAGLLLLQFSTEASADWCKYEKDIEKTLDLSSSDVLKITAAAGDLEIAGVSGTDQAVIRGKACASKQEWLDESGVSITEGRSAAISVDLPKTDGGWTSFMNNYASLDLEIQVPQDLAIEVRDSSGDIFIENAALTRLKDSSGDIEVEDARSSVSISDSSGDIEIDRITGNITIEADSSGDIELNDVTGSVLVKRDSSGDIDVAHVSSDVVVERDSSGHISATDVDGDFRVLKDGSGGISSSDIQGEIDIPKKG
jgi:hypothetical protein